MYELATSNEQIENSLVLFTLIPGSYLLFTSFGRGVVSWRDKVCTTTAFYTPTPKQQLAAWAQNDVYAQFMRFCSSILSTYFNKLYSLLFIIYTPLPQPLLLKKLSNKIGVM